MPKRASRKKDKSALGPSQRTIGHEARLAKFPESIWSETSLDLPTKAPCVAVRLPLPNLISQKKSPLTSWFLLIMRLYQIKSQESPVYPSGTQAHCGGCQGYLRSKLGPKVNCFISGQPTLCSLFKIYSKYKPSWKEWDIPQNPISSVGHVPSFHCWNGPVPYQVFQNITAGLYVESIIAANNT